MIYHYFGLTNNVIKKSTSEIIMIINLATFFSWVIEPILNSLGLLLQMVLLYLF